MGKTKNVTFVKHEKMRLDVNNYIPIFYTHKAFY